MAFTGRQRPQPGRGAPRLVLSEEWLAARKRLDRAAEKRCSHQACCPVCGLEMVVVTDSDERSGAPPPATLEVQPA